MKLSDYIQASSLMIDPHPVQTLSIPPYYKDPDGHNKAVWDLELDSSLAYARALHWKTTGNEQARDLAKKYILAWLSLVRIDNDEAKLVFAYKGHRFIHAALWLSWEPDERMAIINWLANVVDPVAGDLITHWNNWGAWGYALRSFVLKFSCAEGLQSLSCEADRHLSRASWNVPLFGGKNHLWMENMRTTYGLKYGWFALEAYLLTAVNTGDKALLDQVAKCLEAYEPYVDKPDTYKWKDLKWLVPIFVFPSGQEFLTGSPSSWPGQVYYVAGKLTGRPYWMAYADIDIHDGFNAFRWPNKMC